MRLTPIEIWGLVGILTAAACAAVWICHMCLRRALRALHGLWDDIYFLLRERCQLVQALSRHMRTLLPGDSRVADDIDYLLQRMETTHQPFTHAAVQNGLVLTVQTAVEQFHRDPRFDAQPEISKTMDAIAVLDSHLAPLRDQFNERTRRYNSRLGQIPFFLAAWLTVHRERPLFPMLIPWWSTNPTAYGRTLPDEIRRHLQENKAPLILAPSRRDGAAAGPLILHVPDELRKELSAPIPARKTTTGTAANRAADKR